MKEMIAKKQPPSRGRQFWTAPRIALTLVVFSLIAAVGISSCTSGDQKSEVPAGNTSQTGNATPSSVARNDVAPVRNAAVGLGVLPPNVREANLRTVSGQTIKLSDYAGKVVLVNLWATWCGPCRIETPELVKLHKEFQSRGVEMIGLSTENPDATADAVREFVRDFKVDYRIGWATPEVALTLMQGRDAIPQSFIISRDGRIVRRFVGFNPGNIPPEMAIMTATPQRIREAVERALSEKG